MTGESMESLHFSGLDRTKAIVLLASGALTLVAACSDGGADNRFDVEDKIYGSTVTVGCDVARYSIDKGGVMNLKKGESTLVVRNIDGKVSYYVKGAKNLSIAITKKDEGNAFGAVRFNAERTDC